MRHPTIIAVNHQADHDRRHAIPDTWAVWPTAEPAGVTYHRLAATATDEGWDQSTIVIQDDIRWTAPPRIHHTAEIVLYGAWDKRPPRHACPRAFAASSAGWERLRAAWSGHPDRLCEPFLTAVSESAVMFLDQIEHLEAPGRRPWPRTDGGAGS